MSGRAALIVAGLAAVAASSTSSTARAEDGGRPSSSGGEPCSVGCGHVQAWETVESGSGPETGPATLLGLGVASATLRAAGGERSESAAVLAFEFRFPLTTNLDARTAEERSLRLRVNLQQLGWRVGTLASGEGAGAGAGAANGDARIDLATPATPGTGGSVALGYTETLWWLSRWSKLAATVDVEGASGLAVRCGLGLRTLDVGARAVGAGGAALGLHSRIGGLRAHARYLRALAGDVGWSKALELGAGVSTRFDWPRFHGPWPVELWADVRDRRELVDGGAREREVTTGISYVRGDGFSRIGLLVGAGDERLAGGATVTARSVMVRFERPFGDQ